MKNLTKIFMTVVGGGIIAFSCVTDTTDDLGIKVDGQKGVNEIILSLEESRTHLGEKAEGVYPLYWSEGDAISVNGIASTPLTAEQAGAAAATFSLGENEVAYPYQIVYPASSAVTVEEGETTTTVFPINFLASQAYTVGTFAPQAAPMYAYATAPAEGEVASAVQLNHLTGVLRLAIKGNGEKVTGIRVFAEKGKIAGPFTVDCTNGALTAQDGASNIVNVTFAEGLVLGADATPVYVTVPSGNYGTFMITISTEAHEKMTVKFSSEVKPINAGSVREFGEFTYAANAADTDDADFIIDSKEALVEFARIAGTFYPRTSAKVTADINMEGYDWKPIEGFGAFSFDGGDFTINGLNAPLFGQTAATIQNLNLTGVNIVCSESQGYYGAIAGSITGGGLTNCSAEGTMSYTHTVATIQRIGGLVGMLDGCSFTNCTNDVDITIVGALTELNNSLIHLGGVVGWVQNPKCNIEESVNNGTITVTGTIDRINAGGFIGYCDAAANINNCHNHGEMLLAANVPGESYSIFTGFIGSSDAGFDVQNPVFTVTNCSNTADVTFGAKGGESVTPEVGSIDATFHLGGFHGHTRDVSDANFSVVFTNCTNSGNVEVNCLASNTATKVTGMISQPSTNVTLDQCTNSGKLSIISGVTKAPTIAGFFADITNEADNDAMTVTITNSSNEGDIYISENISHTNTGTQGGIIGYFNTTTATLSMNNVYNNGAMTLGQICANVNIYVGGLVGYNKGNLSVENCGKTKALTFTGGLDEISNNAYIGGAFGYTGAPNYILFKNVTNSGDITISGTLCENLMTGGVVGSAGGGAINFDSCSNSGTISVESSSDSHIKCGHIGGIFGAALKYGLQTTFTSCTNSGNISLSNTTFAYNYGVAGISGQSGYDATNQKLYSNIVMTNCTNEGDITVTNSTSDGFHSSVGGLLAASTMSSATLEITNPVQNGDITVTDNSAEGFSQGIQVGGIVAWAKHGTITNTDANRGTVSGNFSITTNAITGIPYVAGVLGLNEGVTEISGIKVISTTENPSSISFTKAGDAAAISNSYVAGLVGLTQTVAATYTNLSNAASLTTTIPSHGQNADGDDAHPYVGGCFARNGVAINATNCSNSGDIEVNIPTYTNWGCYAGVIGYMGGANSTFESCSNTGNLTVNTSTASARTYLGGVAGFSDAVAEYDTCHNSGDGKLTVNITTSLTNDNAVGGVIAWMNKAATLKSCYNTQPINYNVKTVNYAQFLGGIAGHLAIASSLTSCYNTGDITFNPTTQATGYLAIAGMVGRAYGTITASGCYNEGAITLKKSKYGAIYLGGAVGYSAENYTNTKGDGKGFTNCYNKGNITIEDGSTSTGNVRMSGFHGHNVKKIYDTNVHNYGNITIGVKTSTQILVGGIYGYSGVDMTMDGGYVNTGNITITKNGGIGSGTNQFQTAVGGIVGVYYFDIENAINTGNITMLGSVTDVDKATFGGIVGHTYPKGTIQDCKSYCTIQAIGYEGKNVGMIAAHPRTAEVANVAKQFAVVRNCELGGAVAFEEGDTPDNDGNTIYGPVLIPLTSENFYNYIYGQNSVPGSDNDGCTLITTAPTFTRLDE